MADDSIITEIRVTMARLEEKIDNISDAKTTADEAKQIANTALASTKSAHRRLDKMDKIIFWAATSIIGTVVVALIGLLISNGGN
mgnify:CR=1 FL=1